MRIGVFGRDGFLGSAIGSHIQELGHEVLRLPAPRLSTTATHPRTILLEADSIVESQDFSYLAELDVVVNAAGLARATSNNRSELNGANALLPCVLALAARKFDTARYLHISSAAVQGRTECLDESPTLSPSSPYGLSKSLAEAALSLQNLDTTLVFRPTSVHGHGRSLTQQLTKLARSPIASVAAPGTDPTPQVHVGQVAIAVGHLVDLSLEPPQITLQPWSGFTTASFLTSLSEGSAPHMIDRRTAAAFVRASAMTGRRVHHLAGYSRRLEMLLFGQRQSSGWLDFHDVTLTRMNHVW